MASHVALLHRGRLILAEPLDELRASTALLSLTLDGAVSPPPFPAVPGLDLIDAEAAPRQARWLVRVGDRSALVAIRGLPGVAGLEAEAPGLEEIYLGYMRGRRPAGEPAPAASARVA